jgi:quinol monooxygenase YgiN
MILASIRMVIPAQRRSEVLKTLKSISAEASIQQGCLSSRLYRDENDESVFVVEEVWRNQEDLDRHLRSEDYHLMLLVMEMAEEPPEIKFQSISAAAGLEVVEKARGCKRND